MNPDKSSMAAIISTLVVSMLFPLFLGALPVFVYDEAACELEMEAGRELMALKGLTNVVGAVNCSSWNFPTSIVCRGAPYRIMGDNSTGDYSIKSNLGEPFVEAHGEVVRVSRNVDALALGFGRLALSNLGVYGIATGTRLLNPNSNTNAFYMTSVAHRDDDVSVLIWRNVYLTISGPTNKMELAVSLLNAGLPESERLPPLEPQH